MKMSNSVLSTLVLMFLTFIGFGQDNIQSYSFQSGEVLDILLLNRSPESDSLAKFYFNTAIPIAIRNGYKPNKGFAIKNTPLQGNYHPQAMVIASWPSEAVRKKCLVELENEVGNFHRLRRAIWTNFNVSYYPLDRDLDFQVDKDKYNVVTAYWEKKGKDASEFISKWSKSVQLNGGETIVELSNVKSTFGYIYTPEYLSITTWESEEDYNQFKKINLEMDHSLVEQVHQFRIQ